MDKIANASFLTEKETEFLGHILNDAWYQIDQNNLTDEGLEIFKSIEKIKEQKCLIGHKTKLRFLPQKQQTSKKLRTSLKKGVGQLLKNRIGKKYLKEMKKKFFLKKPLGKRRATDH